MKTPRPHRSSSGTRRASGARSASTDTERQSALATYFQGMSSGGLLDAKGEAALASQLRSEEEAIWQHLFSVPTLVEPMSAFVESRLGERNTSASEGQASDKKVNFKSLRAAATRAKKSPKRGGEKKATGLKALERAAGKCAEALRELDPDQELLAEVFALFSDAGDAGTLSNYASAAAIKGVHQELRALQSLATRTRNRFVEKNLGLVVSVARRYQFSGMSLADLIQEGNLGLIKAVARFDDRKGFRFSTYATWWIRHAIGRAVADKSRTVRVPVHVTETHQKLRKVTQDLSLELGRDPTRDEIAERAEMSVRKLERTMQSAQATAVSLDAPVGDDGDRERLEVFSSDTEDSAYERLATFALSERATRALGTLAPLEIEILHRRFGLDGERATTLQEIANTIGKSRERIRQIQEKALQKLRDTLVAEHAI